MKKGKKIYFITSFILLLLIVIVISYAFYKGSIIANTNKKSLEVTTKFLAVEYVDGKSNIELDSTISPGTIITKEFKVINHDDENSHLYNLVFDNVSTNFKRIQDWTYTLTKNGEIISEGILPLTDTFIIKDVNLNSKVADSFVLTIEYLKLGYIDQSEDMDAYLKFRINITDNYIDWSNSSNGTLLNLLKNNNTISNTETMPGQVTSSSNEAVLSSTEDNYGISYYFRGNVKNNYLNFAGMCWRIVRVEGNGKIKIALADGNNECNSSSYSSDNTLAAFIGEKYSFDQVETNLQNWFNNSNIDTSKVATTVWCSDKNIAVVDGYYTYYEGFSRISPKNTAVPSLKCNYNNINGSSAVMTASKVGLLTADELAFAGASLWSSATPTNYLVDNTGGDYWTMTPSTINATNDTGTYIFHNNWYVNSVGHIGQYIAFNEIRPYNTWNYTLHIRPVISLNSTVEATGGGTIDDPYVI